MKFTFLMSALLGLSLTACSTKEEKPKEYEVMSRTLKGASEVTDIDYKTREIMLKTDEGTTTFKAGPEVKNFDLIEVGDKVVAEYKQSMVYTLDKTGKMEPADLSDMSWRAQPGETPGAGSKTVLNATLMVSGIDRKNNRVTLRDAEGELATLAVKHPERLKEIDVGDTIHVKYTEALAVKVEKVQAQEAK